jgi:hypothetical protein
MSGSSNPDMNPGWIVTTQKISSYDVLVYAGGEFEDEIADFARLAEIAETSEDVRREFIDTAELVLAILASAQRHRIEGRG